MIVEVIGAHMPHLEDFADLEDIIDAPVTLSPTSPRSPKSSSSMPPPPPPPVPEQPPAPEQQPVPEQPPAPEQQPVPEQPLARIRDHLAHDIASWMATDVQNDAWHEDGITTGRNRARNQVSPLSRLPLPPPPPAPPRNRPGSPPAAPMARPAPKARPQEPIRELNRVAGGAPQPAEARAEHDGGWKESASGAAGSDGGIEDAICNVCFKIHSGECKEDELMKKVMMLHGSFCRTSKTRSGSASPRHRVPLPPRDHLAHDIASWMATHVQMDPDALKRVSKMFYMANFRPQVCVEGVDKVMMPIRNPTLGFTHEVWWRIRFNETVQQPTLPQTHPDEWRRLRADRKFWDYVGMHGTETLGAVNILRTRMVHKMTMPGVYCLSLHPKSFSCIQGLASKVACGRKNLCDCLVEMNVSTVLDSFNSGRISTVDAATVAKFHISHINRSRDNRYCYPMELIKFRAFWITQSSVMDIDATTLAPL